MTGDLRIDSYDWSGGREAMLRFGPEGGATVVAALPLLEEANRTRAFVVTLLRLLAERGIGGVLPDLPGQGESLVATERMTLTDLRTAFAAACPPGAYAIALRSGTLLDAGAARRWRFAPQTGAELLREWRRVAGGDLTGETVEIAGNLLSLSTISDLTVIPADPAEDRYDGVRVVRLESDPRPADRKVPGQPLWRRAEPDDDPALAALLADDIARWIATCGR